MLINCSLFCHLFIFSHSCSVNLELFSLHQISSLRSAWANSRSARDVMADSDPSTPSVRVRRFFSSLASAAISIINTCSPGHGASSNQQSVHEASSNEQLCSSPSDAININHCNWEIEKSHMVGLPPIKFQRIRCDKYVHHVCLIEWAKSNNLPEGSISTYC